MRIRTPLAGLVAFAVAAIGLVAAAVPPAAAAPSGTIAEPAADGALYTRAPILVRGTLSGATQTVVAVQDRVSKLWWHADGSWGDYEGQQAALDAGSWSFTWPSPEPGDYLVQAKAVASDGSYDPALPYRRFTVVDLPAALAAPAGLIAEPAPGGIVPVGQKTTIRGVAQASGGVVWAGVTILDRAAHAWWHADGTWGAYERQPVTIGASGASRVAWSFDWTPPKDGDYLLEVATRDAGGVTAVSPSVVFAADGAPPSVTAAGQASYPVQHPITWTGSASDNRGVVSVSVAIYDRAAKLWARDDGTWGDYQSRPATLTGPDGGMPWTASSTGQFAFSQVGWTFTWTPPRPGDYGLSVYATDSIGLLDTAHPWLPFTVTAPGQDAEPPVGEVTAPLPDQGLTSPGIRVAGTVTDDVAVDKVRVGVQNRDTGKWWQAGGTWGETPGWAVATLTGSTWSYQWEAPAAGHYSVTVRFADKAGRESSRWRGFDHDPGADGRYVTLLMSRSQWSAVDRACRPLRGAVKLDEVAREFKARGFPASGTVVVDRTLDQNRQCLAGFVDYANWADLATLRDQYGWTFVSHGMGYRNVTTLTPEQQRAESCGSLAPLASRGHTRAWGLFAYPDDRLTTQIQQDVVSTCFAFGRKYGNGVTSRSDLAPPYFQNTWSLPAGRCDDPSLLCNRWVPSVTGANDYRYTSPDQLAEFLRGYPGRWRVLQAYRFMRGKRIVDTGQGESWDCTGTSWRGHWTGGAEAYCLNDFLTALRMAGGQATVTDPAAVAGAWGRGDRTAP
ncbi:Ig-like domain-containing protein [Sphaerisporangium sp. NBC_01403]|uniref:Ig-like domain-containing protein n=1 Tax=Sphaerisporangium sp. NBC_01403 TaxID=2903599 RepID=UPI00324B7179